MYVYKKQFLEECASQQGCEKIASFEIMQRMWCTCFAETRQVWIYQHTIGEYQLDNTKYEHTSMVVMNIITGLNLLMFCWNVCKFILTIPFEHSILFCEHMSIWELEVLSSEWGFYMLNVHIYYRTCNSNTNVLSVNGVQGNDEWPETSEIQE